MEFLDPRALKNQASQRLAAASYDPKKLALIHSAAAVGVSLLLMLMNYLINHQMESTISGLSGMGMRSILGTIQLGLQNIASIAMPFWEIGLVFAALRIFRGEGTGPKDLLEGFRRFGSVLWLNLFQGLLYGGLAFVSLYFGTYIAMMLPSAQSAVALLMETASTADMAQVEQLIETMPVEQLQQLLIPMFAIFGVIFLLAAIPMFYRFRMARFVIMDQPAVGAMAAMVISSRMTRHCRRKLFRLDLSFWWFYLVAALAAVLAYADVLMSMLGVALPFHAETFSLMVYVLGLLVTLVLYWRRNSYVQTTYAAAYEALRTREPEPPKPAPQNVPWDNYYEQK